MQKVKVAVMASGRGSNAQKIINYTQRKDSPYEVVLVVSNKAHAGVLEMAASEGITAMHVPHKDVKEESLFGQLLSAHGVDLIVLAGYLRLIPSYLIASYPKRILNIHPALLPKYGGKGMHGMHVHHAVKEANEAETGITIHFVNEHYDEGQVLFQTRCQIKLSDTAEMIADEVLGLEHEFYPRVIAGVASRLY